MDKEPANIDDIVETVNHFQCFDYMLECANDDLTEGIIKRFHLILKINTSDSRKSWFVVGGYKKRPNIVGDTPTTPPGKVQDEIKQLIDDYQRKNKITFEDIIEFHYRFERIHPFQDAHVIIRTKLEKPSKINGLHYFSPYFLCPEGGVVSQHF